MDDTNRQYSRAMTGRKVIYTRYPHVDGDNLRTVLSEAMEIHEGNSSDIHYLDNYYRGRQPILFKTKAVRPEINNKIVRNHAQEIVRFKVGYLLNQDIEFVSRDGVKADDITKLSAYFDAEGKSSSDQRLMTDMQTYGVGYRGIFPNREGTGFDESPFELFVLEPATTFVVRSTELGNPVVLAVTYVNIPNEGRRYTCYTPESIFTIEGAEVTEEVNPMGRIPIIEYRLNDERMGCFESVLILLDAINAVESDRLDGLEQLIQSLLVFHNVDIDEETFATLRAEGGLAFKDASDTMRGEVSYLESQLDQTSTQELVDDLYDTALRIVGMPQRNNGSAPNDTSGTAVILHNGWQEAEANARSTELVFKESERELIKIAIDICNVFDNEPIDLKASDVRIQFTRRNYENMQAKVQVLTTMLQTRDDDGIPLIEPSVCFEYCNIFPDPDRVAKLSQEYHDKMEKKKNEKSNTDSRMPFDNTATSQRGEDGGSQGGAREGSSGGDTSKED